MDNTPWNTLVFERFKEKLSSSSKRGYSPVDLTLLITELRADFRSPGSSSILKFQRSSIENGIVQEITLTATYPAQGLFANAGIMMCHSWTLLSSFRCCPPIAFSEPGDSVFPPVTYLLALVAPKLPRPDTQRVGSPVSASTARATELLWHSTVPPAST
jgi:hypothetical protein